MPRSLPPSPSLETLRKEAKALRRDHKRGDASCCTTLRCLDRLRDRTNAEILSEEIRLQECQHALARDYGFASWAALRKEVLGKSGPATMLHLLWSDILAEALRETTAPGDTMVWRDMGAYAPTPADDTIMAAMQARILVEDGYFKTVEAALQARTSAEKRLGEFHGYDEVVLWFDTCLYDHVILIRHLDWFSRRDLHDTRLSLICVEKGLGEHAPDELAGLLAVRRPVTKPQFELAVRAWAAYRSPVPIDVEELLAADTSAMPYLSAAFLDHLQRFPSVRDGLGSIDRVVLTCAEKLGRVKIARLIGECLGSPLTYLSDTLAAKHAQDMASCGKPLLRVDGDEIIWRHPFGKVDVEITDTGREVLAGKADFVKLNGIDRWLGGVHLMGPEAQWRWDPEQRRLVESSQEPTGTGTNALSMPTVYSSPGYRRGRSRGHGI